MIQLNRDSIGYRIRPTALGNSLAADGRVFWPLSFSRRSQQVEVLVFSETLFQRSVAIGLVPTEDSTFDRRQHAPKSAEVVFASRRQPSPLRNGKLLGPVLDDKVELPRRERRHISRSSSRPKRADRRQPPPVKIAVLLPHRSASNRRCEAPCHGYSRNRSSREPLGPVEQKRRSSD